MQKLSTRKIGKTDLELVTLGFGCASLGNLYHPVSDEDAKNTVRYGLDAAT